MVWHGFNVDQRFLVFEGGRKVVRGGEKGYMRMIRKGKYNVDQKYQTSSPSRNKSIN